VSDLAQEYENSQYAELEMLDKKGKVWLVKDIRDKRIWVRKEIEIYSLDAYNKMQGVKNKNTAYIHRVLHCAEKYYVIQEYINGQTLNEIVENKGKVDIEFTKSVMCQVCDGIAFLHKNCIIHRDITSSNVILSVDGTIKLIDLGISRIKSVGKERDTTIMGTIGYAPPEQYGFSQTDAATDIYSCGVLMNYMLTGELPEKQRYKGDMDYISLCCMKMEPKERYQSAEELKDMFLKHKIKKREFLQLPGFRSNRFWKKIISLVVYFMTFSLMVNIERKLEENNFFEIFMIVYTVVFCIIIPFFLATDYVYYLERVPFFAGRPKKQRTMLGIITGVGFGVVFFIIYSMLTA
jgi:serine/threonine protein kinase